MAKTKIIRVKKTIERFKSAKKPITSDIEEMADRLDSVAALDALSISEGGRVLVDNLTQDIIALIDWLSIRGLTEAEAVVRGKCADLKSKIELVRSITRAKRNKDILEDEVAEALKT